MLHPTLTELHEEFIAECRYTARLAPATLRNYRAAFVVFTTVMPNLLLSSLTATTLTHFFRELETRERTSGRSRHRSGVKTSTIATYRAKLSPFFKWLAARQLLPSSPFEGIPFPRVIYDEPQYLRKEQLARIVTAVDVSVEWSSSFIHKRNLAIVTLLLYTGLRKSELLHLRIQDIDLERGELRVGALTSKSKSCRTIPLNTLACRRLADYIEQRNKKRYLTSYLFVADGKDDRFTEQGLKHLVKCVRRASGVKFHVHQLRHTFAVNLIGSGSDVSVVQKLMGHKSIVSTLIYLRSIPSPTMRKSIDALHWDSLL
jgi:site-specific recombinase XerD